MLSIEPAKSYAILIGASQFEDKKLYSLPSVENNVWELKRLFADPRVIGIPCDNVTVIGNASSASEILSPLAKNIKKASKNHTSYKASVGRVTATPTQNCLFYRPNQRLGMPFVLLRKAALGLSLYL